MFAPLLLVLTVPAQAAAVEPETADAICARALARATDEVQAFVPGGCERLERALELFWQPLDATEWPRVIRRPIPLELAARWRAAADQCVEEALSQTLTDRQQRALLTSPLLHDAKLRERVKRRAGTPHVERSASGTRFSEPTCDATPVLLEPGLAPEAVARVLRENAADVSACYDRQLLMQPALAGTVDVEFRVTRAGKIADAVRVGSTVNDPSVEVCILTRLATWSFPTPTQPARVRYRYHLKPRAPP